MRRYTAPLQLPAYGHLLRRLCPLCLVRDRRLVLPVHPVQPLVCRPSYTVLHQRQAGVEWAGHCPHRRALSCPRDHRATPCRNPTIVIATGSSPEACSSQGVQDPTDQQVVQLKWPTGYDACPLIGQARRPFPILLLIPVRYVPGAPPFPDGALQPVSGKQGTDWRRTLRDTGVGPQD